MNDMDLAVRCIEIARLVANAETEIIVLRAEIAVSDQDDDSAALKRIDDLTQDIAALNTEAKELTARMEAQPPLDQAVEVHAERCAS